MRQKANVGRKGRAEAAGEELGESAGPGGCAHAGLPENTAWSSRLMSRQKKDQGLQNHSQAWVGETKKLITISGTILPFCISGPLLSS